MVPVVLVLSPNTMDCADALQQQPVQKISYNLDFLSSFIATSLLGVQASAFKNIPKSDSSRPIVHDVTPDY